jgi:hypothetical protein
MRGGWLLLYQLICGASAPRLQAGVPVVPSRCSRPSIQHQACSDVGMLHRRARRVAGICAASVLEGVLHAGELQRSEGTRRRRHAQQPAGGVVCGG